MRGLAKYVWCEMAHLLRFESSKIAGFYGNKMFAKNFKKWGGWRMVKRSFMHKHIKLQVSMQNPSILNHLKKPMKMHKSSQTSIVKLQLPIFVKNENCLVVNLDGI